jgi:hypothetical protein
MSEHSVPSPWGGGLVRGCNHTDLSLNLAFAFTPSLSPALAGTLSPRERASHAFGSNQ